MEASASDRGKIHVPSGPLPPMGRDEEDNDLKVIQIIDGKAACHWYPPLSQKKEEARKQKLTSHHERHLMPTQGETMLYYLGEKIKINSTVHPVAVVPNSRCITYGSGDNTDGRIPVSCGKNSCPMERESGPTKVVYAYHVVAIMKFGDSIVRMVKASKTGKIIFTISHICGVRNCVNPDHLIIEFKQENDTRASCHRVIMTGLEAKWVDDPLQYFWNGGFCQHAPMCCSLISARYLVPDEMKEILEGVYNVKVRKGLHFVQPMRELQKYAATVERMLAESVRRGHLKPRTLPLGDDLLNFRRMGTASFSVLPPSSLLPSGSPIVPVTKQKHGGVLSLLGRECNRAMDAVTKGCTAFSTPRRAPTDRDSFSPCKGQSSPSQRPLKTARMCSPLAPTPPPFPTGISTPGAVAGPSNAPRPSEDPALGELTAEDEAEVLELSQKLKAVHSDVWEDEDFLNHLMMIVDTVCAGLG